MWESCTLEERPAGSTVKDIRWPSLNPLASFRHPLLWFGYTLSAIRVKRLGLPAVTVESN